MHLFSYFFSFFIADEKSNYSGCYAFFINSTWNVKKGKPSQRWLYIFTINSANKMCSLTKMQSSICLKQWSNDYNDEYNKPNNHHCISFHRFHFGIIPPQKHDFSLLCGVFLSAKYFIRFYCKFTFVRDIIIKSQCWYTLLFI